MDTAVIESRIADRLGIKTLTPMQKSLAEHRLPLRAAIVAPTGSGKTLAFTVPVLRALVPGGDAVKAVVLTPTRELALQVWEVVRRLATPEFKTAVFYGGHRMDTEKNSLSGNPDIIIATPGRLLDHIQRGNLSLHDASILVLDEYDKSLELGFLNDMRAIVGRMKNVSTLILTSATRLEVLPDFLGDERVEELDFSGSGAGVQPDIEFLRVDSASADKLKTLDALLRDLGGKRTMVFVNHRDAAERVYDYLHKHGFPAGLYHGGLDQDMRERALVLFSNGTTPVLVGTDLAARGLDIDGVDAVVHYHLPVSPETMTHRNGRTARMGASGSAYAIVSDVDKIPDFFPALNNYWPEGKGDPAPSKWATLYFNVGKKEKVSRGDVAGFVMQKGELGRDEVGRIDVKDHCAYVAVPAAKARQVAVALAPHKIKNRQVRVTQLRQ